jgi:hypothetical protein
MPSNALALREGRPTEVGTVRPAQPPEINFGDLLALSKELVPTGFLPEHIKSAGQCAAIILTGRELGMPPMRALRSLQMVKGKVVENADSQLARFKSDGGRAVWEDLTETRAVLKLRHPNGDEHTATFTIEDARRAGLNGDNWRKYPKAMLRSRAITAGLKDIGWEGGVGEYDPHEAAEFAPTVVVPQVDAASEETGEVPTEAQRTLFDNLMKSHVWEEDERAVALKKFGFATKRKATEMIDRAMQEMQRRKDAETGTAPEVGDAAEPEVAG